MLCWLWVNGFFMLSVIYKIKMTNILYFILASGLFFSALPGGVAIFINEPSWFKNIIYQTSAYLMFTTLIFGFICLLININEKSSQTQRLVILIAIGLVVIPDIYLNSAFFLGRNGADRMTWHLVSLCTALYQVVSTAMLGLIAFGICFAMALSKRFNDNDSPPPSRQ